MLSYKITEKEYMAKRLFPLMLFLLGFLLAFVAAISSTNSVINSIVISVVSFSIGALVALMIREFFSSPFDKTVIGLVVSIIVTFVWTGSIIAEMFILDYTVSPLIHGIMGAIAAFFFKESKLNGGINGRRLQKHD